MTARKTTLWLTLLCVILLFWLDYQVSYQLCLRPSSDISIHATWAAEGDFTDLTSFFHHGAHPMWHALVALVMLLGVPLTTAASLITAACKAVEFLLVLRLMKRTLSKVTALAAAACCVLVSSLCLPWYNPTVYLGVGTPNTWHSPTQMIAMVWMLLCVPYTADCYDRFIRQEKQLGAWAVLPWKNGAVLCLLLVASLAAKPTFMQTFLPAACLFFLAMWIRHPKNSRFFLGVVLWVLPAVVLMVLQYMYYFGIIVPSQGDMVLEISLDKLKNVALGTLLIQAFPIYAILLQRKQPKSTLFWLALWTDAVGVAEFLLLGENGRRAADGNFGWGMMGAALMMWVTVLPGFLADVQKRLAQGKKISLAQGLGFGLLLWHLLSGIYYLIYLLTGSNVI